MRAPSDGDRVPHAEEARRTSRGAGPLPSALLASPAEAFHPQTHSPQGLPGVRRRRSQEDEVVGVVNRLSGRGLLVPFSHKQNQRVAVETPCRGRRVEEHSEGRPAAPLPHF